MKQRKVEQLSFFEVIPARPESSLFSMLFGDMIPDKRE
jgi:hypothetical protein